jgi:membrane-associated phospholipid phosphatase
MLLVAQLVEQSVFLTTVAVVARDRPAQPLDEVGPTASFPSGHTSGAVVFFVGLALVVTWESDHRRRLQAVYLGAVLAVLTGGSRLYRGMHFASDVLWGLALGGAALVVGLLVAHGVPAIRRAVRDGGAAATPSSSS